MNRYSYTHKFNRPRVFRERVYPTRIFRHKKSSLVVMITQRLISNNTMTFTDVWNARYCHLDGTPQDDGEEFAIIESVLLENYEPF